MGCMTFLISVFLFVMALISFNIGGAGGIASGCILLGLTAIGIWITTTLEKYE